MSNLWNINDPDFLDFSELEGRIADFVDRSTIEENLKTQLVEFEMIQSMFSNPGEITVDDLSVLAELQDYSLGKGSALPPQLDFHLHITIELHKFEINVSLPLEYPAQEPDIFVRNDSLGRNEQHNLNEDLSRFISDQPRGDICILAGITWLQENATSYIGKKKADGPRKKARAAEFELLGRLWIYSHHIYSKSKRRELQDLAQEFNLTGFCLPGRPGIICFEGFDADCEDCWAKVKAMNWKKIVCVKKENENISLSSEDNPDGLRRFKQFQEILFEGSKVRGREYHMDFGEFYRYLSQHNSDYAFKMLFGVDGKTSASLMTAE